MFAVVMYCQSSACFCIVPVAGWRSKVMEDGGVLYLNDVDKTTSWDRPNEIPRPSMPQEWLSKVGNNTVDNTTHTKTAPVRATRASNGRPRIGGPPPKLPARPDTNGSARAIEDAPPPSYEHHLKSKTASHKVRNFGADPRVPNHRCSIFSHAVRHSDVKADVLVCVFVGQSACVLRAVAIVYQLRFEG